MPIQCRSSPLRRGARLRPHPPAHRRHRADRRRRSGVHGADAGGDLLPRVPPCRVRHVRAVAVELDGEDRAGRFRLCGRAGLRVARVPPHLDLCAHRPHQEAGGPEGHARSALPNISSPPTCGRARILEDDYGVKPSDIHWIRGGIEEPGRAEKITLNAAAATCGWRTAPEGTTLSRCWRRARSTPSSRRARRHARAGRAEYRLAVPRPDRGRARTTSSAPASSRSCT